MPGRVVVVGLGPAGPDLLTPAAQETIDRVHHRFLRTHRHPSAPAVRTAESFDDVYEQADTFDEVYRTIAARLVGAAAEHGEVLYAVPGSPGVLERTVELLLETPEVQVELVPGLSFVDLVWARLRIDPFAAGARLVDGHRFAEQAAGERGPLLVAHCHARWVLSDIKLAFDDEPPPRAVVLQRLGLPDEAVTEVPWAELDRGVEPDHLTSVWIPEVGAPVAAELVRFAGLVRTLRERCPWDREQTHASLTRYLIEETYEAVEAIEALGAEGAGAEHLEEELGDVLFQVVFHATIAEQEGWFSLADVARTVHDKLYGRHPHVFGGAAADTADDVRRSWEELKRAEKGRASVMDGIPGSLPALLHALKVGKKAASVGFDWSDIEPVYAKVAEELEELRADSSEAELGDVLFAVVNLARHLHLDPEAALRGASSRFRDRFRHVEAEAAARGWDLASHDPAAVDALWEDAKRAVG